MPTTEQAEQRWSNSLRATHRFQPKTVVLVSPAKVGRRHRQGALGRPDAVRGGLISMPIPSWPENLRRFGTGSNTWLNYSLADLCYETLCGMNPITLETTPLLATHWQISDDQMTFRFRINPKAYWSDGKPVVADDWIATYRLLNDDTLIEPMMKQIICEKMEEPVALSKYMIEVKCKEKSWRNFCRCQGSRRSQRMK